MNSYNDNLHSVVVSSLLNQQLELLKTKSTLNASAFTLYYAQAATISVWEKLHQDHLAYQSQQKMKEAAVIANSIALNVNSTTQDQKELTALSNSNMAIAASNIQIASNAILKLAGTIGSIYSVVNAADFDNQIYGVSKEANRLMEITAYQAERTSQIAMESSVLTAQIPSTTIAETSSGTQKCSEDLLNVAQNNLSATMATFDADSANLSKAIHTEKIAEGEMQLKNTNYFAAQSAFAITTKELNFDLRVTQNNKSNTSFDVMFDLYKSPFADDKDEIKSEGSLYRTISVKAAGYPVKSYYIIVVKDLNQSVFSLANAEALLSTPDRFVRIKGAPAYPGKTFVKKTISYTDLKDSDGDSIELGIQYVVFTLVVFMDEHKKTINCFDDYLTAPSNTFILTNVLAGPKPGDIKISKEHRNILEFKVVENVEHQVEYRCLLLPYKADLLQGLLTDNDLRTMETVVETLESIADKFIPATTAVVNEIRSYQAQLAAIQHGDEATSSVNEIADGTLAEKLKAAETKLIQLEKEEKAAKKKLVHQEKNPFRGFLFSIDIAQQVSIANYIVAKEKINSYEIKTSAKKETTKYWQVTFNEDANDVFGNKIDNSLKYIPVLLCISKAPEEKQNSFMNTLSDFRATKPVLNILPII